MEQTGYRKEDMFSDDDYSLNKLIHVVHKAMQTNGKGDIKPIEWLKMFNKALRRRNYDEKVSTQLQVMALRLALTDPMKEFHMINGALAPANQHFSWAAAYAIYGAPWKNREKTRKKSKNAHKCHQSQRCTRTQNPRKQLRTHIFQTVGRKHQGNL